MNSSANKGSRARSNLHFGLRVLIFLIIIGGYPYAKNALFPDQMTQLERLLRDSNVNGCAVDIEFSDRFTILLTTVASGKPPITTQIYRNVVQELESSTDNRIFFAHAINRNSDEVFYLTRTLIEADPDLKQVRHLEVTVCDRIKDQTGQVPYDGHEPIYECEVPILKAICTTAQ